jgi:hypothetical protein
MGYVIISNENQITDDPNRKYLQTIYDSFGQSTINHIEIGKYVGKKNIKGDYFGSNDYYVFTTDPNYNYDASKSQEILNSIVGYNKQNRAFFNANNEPIANLNGITNISKELTYSFPTGGKRSNNKKSKRRHTKKYNKKYNKKRRTQKKK